MKSVMDVLTNRLP